MLCGSEIGGVVVTCTSGLADTSMSFRDLETGARLCELRRPGPVDLMWADDTKIVIINRNLESLSAIVMR